MGIIQKQAIRGSLYNYLGIGVGFINAIILAPHILTSEQIGLMNILVTYSLPFVQFGTLGFIAVINRLFPYFRDAKTRHHGFISLAFTVTMAGFILSLIVYFALRPGFIRDNIEQSPLFVNYIDYLIPLIFFTLLFTLLDAYNRVLYDAVLGTFLKEFLFKILYLIILLVFSFKLITFPQFVFAFILTQCVPALIISVVLLIRRQISFRFDRGYISRRMIRIMANLSLFSVLTGLSGIAISTIDKIMINSMINLSATGIYSVSFYFSVLLIVPVRSVRNISTPVLAELMKKKNFNEIRKVYYKSSINQIVIGSLLFIGIWANIDNVFRILPQEYEAGKYVILFMMIAKLFELAVGVGPTIIGISRYYRVQTYMMTGLIFIVIITNLILIPRYGITGAAIASAISALVINFLRFVYVYWKFKIQPFHYKTLILIVISVISYLAGFIVPELSHLVIDIVVRSVVIALVFGVLVLVFRISDEVESELKAILKRLNINFLQKK